MLSAEYGQLRAGSWGPREGRTDVWKVGEGWGAPCRVHRAPSRVHRTPCRVHSTPMWFGCTPLVLYAPCRVHSTPACHRCTLNVLYCTPNLHTRRSSTVYCMVFVDVLCMYSSLHRSTCTLMYSMCTLQVLCSRGSGCDARPEYTCRDAYFMYSVCILSSHHSCQSTSGVHSEYV